MKALLRQSIIPLAVLASLAPLWPVYETTWAIIVVVTGVALGTTIAVVAFVGVWSLLRTFLVTLAVFAVFGVPLAIPGKTLYGVIPTFDGLLTLASSIVLSWKQLVTVVTPVASYEALLVPAFILALVTSLTGVSLALRPKRRALAALPPIVSLGVSIWLGPLRGFESLAIAAVVFALLVIWFSVSGPRGARGLLRALGVAGAPMLLALVVVSLLVPTQRNVWRAVVEQPFVLQTDTSPLAEYRGYVTGDGVTDVLLIVSGLTPGDRISWATLDRYNGVTYSVGGTAADFTRVPGDVPVEGQSGKQIDSRITISKVSGPWVPLPAELGSIVFEGSGATTLTNNFFYSRSADTGAVMGGLQVGDSYRVRGVAHPVLPVVQLSNLTPGMAVVPAPTVVPDGIEAFVASNVHNAVAPGVRLQNVLAALVTEGYVSSGGPGETPSRSGHGAERITQLFTQVPMVGDGEQYATAAALLANQLGFPARVVMGPVVPPNNSAGAGGEDAEISLTGANMSAWIEVSTTEGWVAVDPNPQIRPIPDQQPEDPTNVSRPQSGVEPPAVDVPRVQDDTPPESAGGELTPAVDPLQGLLATIAITAASGLLILGLLVLPFAAIAALKIRRRARRRAAIGPRERVEGAWAEFTDTARDFGVIFVASSTRREMAKRVPQERSNALAKLVDRVQFAPGAPTETQADEAWRSVDQVREGLDGRLTRWQRVRTRISTRSLTHTALGRLLNSVLGRVPGRVPGRELPRVEPARRTRR